MFQSALAASILLVATICFSSFHTWPYGFPMLDLVWKWYYGIMKFWPESVEDSKSQVIPPSRSKVGRVARLSTAAMARWFLPMLLGFDGILKSPQIFYAPFLTFPTFHDEYLQSIGAIALLMASLIMLWASSFLARYVYGMSPDQRPLIRSGPYRYVRHPVYLSFTLFGIGTFLLSLNFLMLITFSYMVFMAHTYLSEEERELPQKYGMEYEEYKKSTGGLLPKIWCLNGASSNRHTRKLFLTGRL
ncbi:MAG: isoprenylcysteine carboxylmethyltransferase family protein [Thaumarchaeota archaeon]|nr:isoprenylcysteine carboxylmethyltransferase family protein [Nitrososphaerota archaeon]